jgi:hypothetical protein
MRGQSLPASVHRTLQHANNCAAEIVQYVFDEHGHYRLIFADESAKALQVDGA